MRNFSSYGLIETNHHYYAPRENLRTSTIKQLTGDQGGHYITIWAPRQTGKSTLMHQVVEQIKKNNDFEVGMISLQSAKNDKTDEEVFKTLLYELSITFNRSFAPIQAWKDLSRLFSKDYFEKPLILVIDEFDSLEEDFINKFANEFRNIYLRRQSQTGMKSIEKSCLLHGLALIGVRSVLGIENVKGSPFNVQRSIHIPNLTSYEVKHIFNWYEKESNQSIDSQVIDRIYYEFSGHPGLTCWFGEVLTEKYNSEKLLPITLKEFEIAFAASLFALPNNTIMNIISKAKVSPYREVLLDLFQTDKKVPFTYDDIFFNYLYTNGVIDIDKEDQISYYARFPSPFVQKRLFNYFSRDLFRYSGRLTDPFEKIDHIINDSSIHIKNLMQLYERYLAKNKDWLLKDAPTRKDLRIFEAVYHFNLYMFLHNFLSPYKAQVWPEFPTGNGKIDMIIKYGNQIYGIELKSFTNERAYKEAISKSAQYALELQVKSIALVFFVDTIDDENRQKYEKTHEDNATGIAVETIFISCGNT
jgi:hypothetical protein